jgi:FPC/CPF motif-containing protein YcgG
LSVLTTDDPDARLREGTPITSWREVAKLFAEPDGAGSPALPIWAGPAFRQVIGALTDELFPCLFARRANYLQSGWLAFVDSVETEAGRELIRRAVIAYYGELDIHSRERTMTPLIVVVKPSDPALSLPEYRAQAWGLFQYLHDHDPVPWPVDVPTDPDRGDWTFCFGGRQLFSNVSSPAHRLHRSRNLGDSLVFAMQPRTNFDQVAGNNEKGRAVRAEIRRRVEHYDGRPASHLGFYGTPENREWIQMTPMDGEDERDYPRTCPFRFDERADRARKPSRAPVTDLAPQGPPTGDMLRDWNARAYLDYYYGDQVVPDDEAVMFRFVARALRRIEARLPAALDLGCGPVVHRAAQVVPWVDRLDMADVQAVNLDEIRRWIERAPGAFDWSVLIGGPAGVLDAERDAGGPGIGGGGGSLAEREALLRERIRLIPCDLREALPLGAQVQYPLVTTSYCAEWVIPTLAGWRETLRKVASLVASRGWLLMIGAHATDYCVINGRRIPCARISEAELRQALAELGFDPGAIQLELTPGTSPAASGIQETFMVCARRAS